MAERTTSEVARDLGMSAQLLRNWKRRGHLKLAPPGVPGQGRSVECVWSEEAFQEAKAHSEDQSRFTRGRYKPGSYSNSSNK
jgi:transposase-like protein